MKVEPWEWEALEARKIAYGETSDYYHRKQELLTEEENERSHKKFLELFNNIQNNKKTVEVYDDGNSYHEWRDNQHNWSDISRQIRS